LPRRRKPSVPGAPVDPRGGPRSGTPGRSVPAPAWLARFWEKVGPPTGSGCREWTAGRFSKGYGAFSLGGRLQKAHRVAWLLEYGEIPAGALVCHHCDNPPCVEIAHLFLGTHQDNMTDKMRKGRHVPMPGSANPMWGKRKIHCKQGHVLTETNVYRWRDQRLCRTCRRERQRASS
jgi:hypothetical protein